MRSCAHIFKRSRSGFTWVELATIVFLCCLIAMPLLVSALNRGSARSQRIGCANNLKQLGLAFKTWALEHGARFPSTRAPQLDGQNPDGDVFRYFQLSSNVLASPSVLICPADVRLPASDFSRGFNSNLSYFISLDATDTNPEMILSGDRNLTNGPLGRDRILLINTNYPLGWTREMHRYQGNIALADGSVQQFSNNRLKEALTGGGLTNRLAMP